MGHEIRTNKNSVHRKTSLRLFLSGVLAWVAFAALGQDPPVNDDCSGALPSSFGVFSGDTFLSTSDGTSSCDLEMGTPDNWYSLTFPEDQRVFVETPSSSARVALSLHSSCPGTVDNELVCSTSEPIVDQRANFSFNAAIGETYLLRVSTRDGFGSPSSGGYTFRVGRGGAIAGQVTNTEGQPLESIEIFASRNGAFGMETLTDAQGRYRFDELRSGSYSVYAGDNSPYVPEAWDNIPCPFLRCVPSFAVQVELDETTENVDFELELGAAIAGTVEDGLNGGPFEGLAVTLYDLDSAIQDFIAIDSTDSEGRYRFEGLEAGRYAVVSEIEESYRSEVWDDVPCSHFGCDPATGSPLVLERGETADPIDFVLDRGTSISGRLVDGATQQPIAFERVQLRDSAGDFEALARTDGEGRYILDVLNPGTYLVQTETDTYINEVWDDIPCPTGGECPYASATPIVVDLEQPASNIDFALDVGGTIRGLVVDAATGSPVSGGLVVIYNGVGSIVDIGFALSNGSYEVGGLPAGSYFAASYDRDMAYAPVLHQGIPCGETVETCDVLSGTPIAVTLGGVTTVNFSLDLLPSTCDSDFETLCLNQGRFEVRAIARTSNGSEFRARAQPLDGIDDSGTFWFFDPDNTELVVKVLDACFDPWQHFWVFAAGLTNVEVEMKVIDTLTGEQRTYFNAQGTPFQPLQDTRAFATCGSRDGIGRSSTLNGVLEDLRSTFGDSALREPIGSLLDEQRSTRTDASDSAPGQSGGCTPDSNTLCLGDGGRFQVEAAWETSAGDTGDGFAIPLVADTGMFWFFGPSNVELVVKVLSNCGGPTDRFWVFAAGLTNVEVTITVTDTATGLVRNYQNPLGTSFQPIQDTQAFPTCSEIL